MLSDEQMKLIQMITDAHARLELSVDNSQARMERNVKREAWELKKQIEELDKRFINMSKDLSALKASVKVYVWAASAFCSLVVLVLARITRL